MTPRATSVALVEVAVAHIGNRRSRVVDVGTGSGAIAIAICEEVTERDCLGNGPELRGSRARAKKCRKWTRGRPSLVREGDLLEPVTGLVDLVVANLPYLPADERELHPSFAAEPTDAVFASGRWVRLLPAGSCKQPTRRLSERGFLRCNCAGTCTARRRGSSRPRDSFPGDCGMTETVSQPLDFCAENYDGVHFERAEALARSRAFLDLMRQRRSIRHFAPDAVPFELIENALRVAGSAPSGANQQPWTFVVVSDPAMKERIRAAAEHEEELLYRERAGDEYLDAIRPIGTNASKPHITDAPYLIAVFEQAWRFDEDGKRKHYYVRESVGIAVGFLLTALHTSGLVALTHAPSPWASSRRSSSGPTTNDRSC